jgi:hypothetical protein
MSTEGVGIIEDVSGEIFYAPEMIAPENARDFKGRVVVVDTVSVLKTERAPACAKLSCLN